MIKKNINLKKTKKRNKKNNFVRNKKKQIRINTYKQYPKHKNLSKLLNKVRIKVLLNFFNKNIVGVPVKLTNLELLKKRPIVINKNELGINADLLKAKKKRILAFTTVASAYAYKLKNKKEKKIVIKSVPEVSEDKKRTIEKKEPQYLDYLKETKNEIYSQILGEAYTSTRKLLKKEKKHNVVKFKNVRASLFKKLMKLRKKIRSKHYYRYNTKLFKRHILFLDKKRIIKKYKKKVGTAFWRSRVGKLKKNIVNSYKNESITHNLEKVRFVDDLINANKIIDIKNKEKEKIKNNKFMDALFNVFDNSKKHEENMKKTYTEALMYLTKVQKRNRFGISQRNSQQKIQNLINKEEKKQVLIIQGQIKKQIISIVTKEEQKKIEEKKHRKDILVKILLNIIRGRGQTNTMNRGTLNIMHYLTGLKNLQGLSNIELFEEQIKARLINDLMKKKDLTAILEYQKELMQKYLEYNKVANAFPKKWVRPEIFNPFIKNYYKKKNEFEYCKQKQYRLLGLNNVYNILNNIVAENDNIYNLRLPKKRIMVPNLKQIYKGLKNHSIPRYKKTRKYKKKQKKKLQKQKKRERRLRKLGIKVNRQRKKQKKKKTKKLKVGILRIKLKRRNMFLVFRDRKTNKVEATTSARKEYYKIYRPEDNTPGRRKKEIKAPVVKAKGPIGRYISTDQFRVRVLTQAFLDLRHKIKYNVLDIEIEKKYKKKFIRTIYKKYWYVFRPQGLFRICRFVKNKPHGQMRKKKARRR